MKLLLFQLCLNLICALDIYWVNQALCNLATLYISDTDLLRTLSSLKEILTRFEQLNILISFASECFIWDCCLNNKQNFYIPFFAFFKTFSFIVPVSIAVFAARVVIKKVNRPFTWHPSNTYQNCIVRLGIRYRCI